MTGAELEELIAMGSRRRERLPSPQIRRHVREQAGLTQQEVADFLRVSRPAVNRYERGTREPRGRVRDEYHVLLERLTAVISS